MGADRRNLIRSLQMQEDLEAKIVQQAKKIKELERKYNDVKLQRDMFQENLQELTVRIKSVGTEKDDCGNCTHNLICQLHQINLQKIKCPMWRK